MIPRIAISALLTAAAFAANTVVYPSAASCGGCLASVFINGYLFHMSGGADSHSPPQTIAVYGPGGNLLYEVPVAAPDGSQARLSQSGVAVDSDGTVALTMWYGDCCSPPHAKGGAIAFLDAHGKQFRTLDTGLYHPNALTFGPDHSFWTMGTQFSAAKYGAEKDYMIVRHFSQDGAQLGAFLPRSSFSPGLQPSGSGLSFMRTAADRIGMMTYPGMVSDTPTWIEMDFNGAVLGQWIVKPAIPGSHAVYGYTADARLFEQVYDSVARHQTLWVFNKASSSWTASAGSPDTRSTLQGTDGNQLVFWTPPGPASGGITMVWAPAP